MKDSAADPCEFCGSDNLYVKGEKHTCHWSRETINTVKCKVCDRIISMDDYLKGNI
jgi:hypothetical protein